MSQHLTSEQRNVIENLIGSWRMEGLEPSAEIVRDMERVSAGEISCEEAVQSAIARALSHA
ncbi:MAG: antitoxin VbhA family protein [Neisseria sp.]|nr:antitoxin VbhA family protein [Neisseria sp.]